jgi:glycosyltransferase involved in cell wall biosynthesis
MKIILLNQYFYPDIASTGIYAADICAELAKAGNEITVICAEPCYSENSPLAPYYEIRENIKIERIKLGRWKGREHLKKRVVGYAIYLVKSFFKTIQLLKKDKYQIIITFHNPPIIGLLGAYLSKKYDAKFIFIPYDIHPDILIASGWKIPYMLTKLIELANKKTLNAANKIIVLSEDMRSFLVTKYSINKCKIEVIPLWALPEIAADTDNTRHSKANKIILLYAGNMGYSHPAEDIVDAFKSIRDLPIELVFVGSGVKTGIIKKMIDSENIKNIHILPYQPTEKFKSLLISSDACLVTIARGLENLALPSRTFTYLSAGKPIIAFMNKKASIAKLVLENKCGWVAETKDELINIFSELNNKKNELKEKGEIAKEVYRTKYKKEIVLSKYIEVVQKLINDKSY